MNESGVYNERDLNPFHKRIAELRQIIKNDGESKRHSKAMIELLERQLKDCGTFSPSSQPHISSSQRRRLLSIDGILKELQGSLSVISPELIPIHERLVNIRRKLAALAAKEKLKQTDIKPLLEELRKIDSLSVFIMDRVKKLYLNVSPSHYTQLYGSPSGNLYNFPPYPPRYPSAAIVTCSKRVDGKFLGPNGTVPASQAVCTSLLEECFDISQEIKAQDESKYVADALKPIFDRLTEIRRELEGFALTHRWSLRETDLWNYTLSLQEIDKMRVDGKFVDLEKNVPQGQYVSILLVTLRLLDDLHALLFS